MHNLKREMGNHGTLGTSGTSLYHIFDMIDRPVLAQISVGNSVIGVAGTKGGGALKHTHPISEKTRKSGTLFSRKKSTFE